MQTVEINGFLIDEFNQHRLEEGKKQGICPLCSHTRKPKNQKLKCASYDWERGLGTCHNCNTSFQLHTYQRKGSSQKEYIKPINKDVIPDFIESSPRSGPTVLSSTTNNGVGKAPDLKSNAKSVAS